MVDPALFDTDAIARVSNRYGVRRLRVFGSVLTDRFDPNHSDVDFLVDFSPNREDRLDDYLGLKEALAEIVGRNVDLVVADAVRNPYFKKAAFGNAKEVYAA
ncbi:MAG: nucleotidyltransferase family protein [Gulosibacter sp.]|uniref:nucleotidyltransferase family protein n=1 Tax=Gulosibacter sp. TaxID=2817531 RepID=UPI003F9032EA